MDRRTFLGTGITFGAAALATSLIPNAALAQQITLDDILHDPDVPEAGNPKGDLTIVEFFDYNCPYCKKSNPFLERVVKEDGNIRLVYKDWPILAKSSMYGARLALGARYQDAYLKVHAALMDIEGYGIKEDKMLAAVKAAGVDTVKLEADIKAHETDISALIKRNMTQADALGLRGTPVYLIGPYIIPSALDYEGFKQAVDDARKAQAQK